MPLSKDDKVVKLLCEEFINHTLMDESPNNMCFTICFPLTEYLKLNGLEPSIRRGYFRDFSAQHFWINLDDERNTIVDPTIRQFDKSMPHLFYGQPTNDYREIVKVEGNQLFDTIQKWVNPNILNSKETIDEILRVSARAEKVLNDLLCTFKINGYESVYLKALNHLRENIESYK